MIKSIKPLLFMYTIYILQGQQYRFSPLNTTYSIVGDDGVLHLDLGFYFRSILANKSLKLSFVNLYPLTNSKFPFNKICWSTGAKFNLVTQDFKFLWMIDKIWWMKREATNFHYFYEMEILHFWECSVSICTVLLGLEKRNFK